MKKLFKTIVLLMPLAGVGMWGGNTYAAACTSAATGNWSNKNTWAAPCNVNGGPTAADTATILNTHNVTANAAVTVGAVTVDAGGTLTFAGGGGSNFTVNGATSVSGTVAHTTTGGAETYVGLLTINAGGTWTNAINESVTLRGGLTFNGATFTAGTGIYTFSTAAAQSVNCAAALAIPHITVTAPTVLTNNCNLTVSTALAGTGSLVNSAAGILNIQGASSITTLNNQGTATVTGAGAISTALANFTNTGTLNLNGTGTITGITNNSIINLTSFGTITALTNNAAGTLNISAVPVPAITTLTANAAGNTVNYTGAGAQTVKVTAYSNLILSGSGAKTMGGVTAIGGNLSISDTATMTGNTAFTVTGALNYSSTGATTLNAATPVSIGSFNQSAGTFIDNGNTITVTGTSAGTWAQSGGTFTPTGTVIFTGTAPQIGVSSFNNLTINTGAGNTATLTGNATATGVLTLTSGLVSTGTNILEVTSSCATGISGGGATSFVLGSLSLHYPAGTTTCAFPIGSAAAYTPATATMYSVTSTLANSVLTARTDAGDYADTTAGAAGIDPAKSVNRYWTFVPGGSLAFATYDTTFTFVAGDIDGGASTGNFIIGRKSGISWSYPTMGAKNPTNTTATGMTQADGFGVYIIGERIMPSITLLKTVAVYSDPVNLLVNPKFIPGAIGQYTIIASNSGGPVDTSTALNCTPASCPFAVVDPVPANTRLYVNDIGGAGSGPVLFTQGATTSTLTYAKATDLAFSNDGGATWNAVPIADASGCDATVPPVTHVRVSPKGTFVGSAVAPNPSFHLTFRVCVK